MKERRNADSSASGCEALLGLDDEAKLSLADKLDRWLDEVLGKDGHGRDNI